MPKLNECNNCGSQDPENSGLCFYCAEAMEEAEGQTISSVKQKLRWIAERVQQLNPDLPLAQERTDLYILEEARVIIAWLNRLDDVV